MIVTLVRVPVLSEQIVLTEPRVSTVLRDLHRILFFFMMLAVIVRLAVTAIGRPSGMKATATLTQSTIKIDTVIQLGWSFRSHVALENVLVSASFESDRTPYQTIMTMTTIVSMIATIVATK
jgi:hypothetical protein